MAAPNSVSAAPSATASHANAGSTSVAADASVETDATSRLPACAISQPESGIATSDPAPRPASAPPSAAGDSASAACTRAAARPTSRTRTRGRRTACRWPSAPPAWRPPTRHRGWTGIERGHADEHVGQALAAMIPHSREGGECVRMLTRLAVLLLSVRDRYPAGPRANAAVRPAVTSPLDPALDRRQDEGLREAGRLRPALLEPCRRHDLARDPGARLRAALLHVAVGRPRLERHRPRSRPARRLARRALPADRQEGAAGRAELRRSARPATTPTSGAP